MVVTSRIRMLSGQRLRAIVADYSDVDESTSAVCGMPRAVFQAGLSDVILPLPRLIPEMLARLAALSCKSKPETQYNSMAMVKP